MKVIFPERLYRYRSPNTPYFRDEITNTLNRRIFLSSAENLNDPFDFRPSYQPSKLKDILSLLKKIYGRKPVIPKQRFEELLGRQVSRAAYRKEAQKLRPGPTLAKSEIEFNSNVLRELPRQGRVACFSEQRNNIPMWAHYADNHAGICVVYRVSSSKLDPINGLVPFEVNYQNERPVLTTVDLINFARNESAKRNGNLDPTRVMDAMYLRKSTHWSYEKEWRIFDNSKRLPRYHSVPALEVESIVLGLRAKESTVEAVKEMTKGLFPVFRLSRAKDEFGFSEERVS